MSPPRLSASELDNLILPLSVLRKPWAAHLSVVAPLDSNTFCFTGGYGKVFHKSSGSLVLPEQGLRLADEEIMESSLDKSRGMEVSPAILINAALMQVMS